MPPSIEPQLAAADDASDTERDGIVSEEEACLARVLSHLAAHSGRGKDNRRDVADYDARLLDLRDQIAAARMEDVPPLVQEMERLQSLAVRLREVNETEIDVRSPYFGRLVLEENGRQREILIGRGTHLDTQSGIRIVDWRDAPVSRIFYRYDEGADYDETFGGREVSGTIQVRRSLAIVESALRRIVAPQGTFARSGGGEWRRLGTSATRLAGGAGSAIRAEQHHRPGKLGTQREGGEDKQLKEITPLIDRRQFELITRPDSGLVVIQGGAGSGKTTIGLHRLAYLAFQDPRRFRPDRMLVIVFNDALSRYIAGVLPALGVNGVAIRTYEDWARRLRTALFPSLPRKSRDDTPSVVTRLKKHPTMLHAIEAHAGALNHKFDTLVQQVLEREGESAANLSAHWNGSASKVLAHRLHGLAARLEGGEGRVLSTDGRIALERHIRTGLAATRDVVQQWAELLSDRAALGRVFEKFAPGAFSVGELDRAHGWCAARVVEILEEVSEKAEQRQERRDRAEDETEASAPPKGGRSERGEDAEPEEREELRRGIDGRDVQEGAGLDVEDDALLLRMSQRLRGPLTRNSASKEPVVYEHILIDEAQDLSPVELAVVLSTVNRSESVTLAGDVQQRLLMDNGFTDWGTVLSELGLAHVEIEPLKLSYRSTQEIIEFSRAVLGPLQSPDAPAATRSGAPVEMFGFAHTGDAVAFLAEALRELISSEPNASIAVVTRYPEQADAYHDGLLRGAVPKLRRIAEQDFPFKPGVDVTDVRQVKGLEFDYVVLVEVTESAYGNEDEARHLLHIGATRAAHQLW
ncbi:MAG TPA: ATP-binding domain-containing protein, partial [Polyangiaceae bacterium]|nr:ATP-binding domain-containing protein [Polyangiaceae bacterium]